MSDSKPPKSDQTFVALLPVIVAAIIVPIGLHGHKRSTTSSIIVAVVIIAIGLAISLAIISIGKGRR